MTPEARPAQKADIPELSAILGRAFYDDPLMTWMLPDDDTRAARLPRMFATLARHHHLAGGGVEVACDGPTMGAAALWDPPNRWRRSSRVQLKMMPMLVRKFGLRVLDTRYLERMAPQHPEEPHWYFAYIGSDPYVRGRGFVPVRYLRLVKDETAGSRLPPGPKAPYGGRL